MAGRSKDEAIRQEINGNKNIQAAGNVDVHYYPPVPKANAIRFYEKDIEEVILAFSEDGEPSSSVIEDFFRPDIEEKNVINKLSNEYFEFINSEYLPYFHQIDKFLRSVQNSKLQECYVKTTVEIRMRIKSCRSNFDSFEEIFSMLLDHVIEKESEILINKRDVMIVFLHYMYWNCDIGDKYVET